MDFSKIYCKAISVPNIYSGNITYDRDADEGDYEPIDPWYRSYQGGKFYPTSTGGTFRDHKGGSLPSLMVPTGCKSKYESNADWKNTFTLIEETEF